MSNIHSILPLLDRDTWRWDKAEISTQTVNPSITKRLFGDPGYPGYLFSGLVVMSGSGAEETVIKLAVDDYEFESSVKRAYEIGATVVGPKAPAVIRYNTTDDLYVILYEPNPPLAYIENIDISVTAPQGKDIVLEASGLKLDILDIDRFSRSYQDVVSGEVINRLQAVGEQMKQLNNNLEQLTDRDVIGDNTI